MNTAFRPATIAALSMAAALLLGACTKTPESRFIASCTRSAEECKCAADLLERRLSKSDFSAMMDVIEATKDGRNAAGNDVGQLILSGGLVNREVSRALVQSSFACARGDADMARRDLPAEAPEPAPPAAPAPAPAPAPAEPADAEPVVAAGGGNPTVIDLKVEPAKYANQRVTLACESIWGADSSGVGCKSQGQTIWIDSESLDKESLRHSLTNCGGFGDDCSGRVTGTARESIGDLRLHDATISFR